MSTNCINCVVNDRTGNDLLCDQCRAVERLQAMLDDDKNQTWDLSPNDKQAICSVLEECESRQRQIAIRDEWIKRARSRAREVGECSVGYRVCEECRDHIKWIDTYSFDEVEADMELDGKLQVKP